MAALKAVTRTSVFQNPLAQMVERQISPHNDTGTESASPIALKGFDEKGLLC
jgi:hypothetical protein